MAELEPYGTPPATPSDSKPPPPLPKRSRARRVIATNDTKAINQINQINTDEINAFVGRYSTPASDDLHHLQHLLPQSSNPTPHNMAARGRKGDRVLHLGDRPKYPIKIIKLYKSPGDEIKEGDPVLQYSFTWNKLLTNQFTQEEEWTTQTTLTTWNSSGEGNIKSWHIKVGQEISRDTACMTIEVPCIHGQEFAGMCAFCGIDMNLVTWAQNPRDTNRAGINMIHDETKFTVSKSMAVQAEAELQERLLSQRKLSLVVDLDQTIIHACIEPTVGEWQQDPNNPNHDALKNVRKFQLDDGPRGLASGCWYYIKLRPGLVDFLNTIATMYELHVYTMGTRAYAENIRQIVDPDRKLFANRVISRDENGNMVAKSLQRLFPVSTNMVVIIDDRADVWPYNRPNLIKVVPYDFFKGIGDINSSFLPQRQDIIAAPAPTALTNGAAGPVAQNGQPNGGPAPQDSPIGSLAAMGGGENPALLKKQTEEQERSLEQQLKDRPLQHMQEQLDKEDEEATQKTEANGDAPPSSPVQRHHVLLDDDEELSHLERHLTSVHRTFYKEYDMMRNASGAKSSPVPDVGEAMDRLKAKVFKGLTIVLSGLVPLGLDVMRSEIGLQVQTFGARVHKQISKQVTHLVISSDRPRTQKVRQAVMFPNIKIVNQNWLADCLSQWRLLDEAPYLIEIHPADRVKITSAFGTPGETTDAETASDVEVEDGSGPKRSNASKLKIVVTKPGNDDDDVASDEDEHELDNPGDMSPIDELKTFDWGAADEELAEFLADESSDDEDADDGSGDKSDMEDSQATASASKRKFEDSADDDATPSKKTKLNNGSHLSEADANLLGKIKDASNKPMPDNPSRGPDDDGKPDFDEIPDDDDDDALEADLLAELEAEEAEEERLKNLS